MLPYDLIFHSIPEENCIGPIFIVISDYLKQVKSQQVINYVYIYNLLPGITVA